MGFSRIKVCAHFFFHLKFKIDEKDLGFRVMELVTMVTLFGATCGMILYVRKIRYGVKNKG